MANWIIYDTETGEVRSATQGGNGKAARYERATAGRLSAIQTVDLVEDTSSVRVEHGRVVPARAIYRLRQAQQTAWFAFRLDRNRRLAATDHMLMPDFPLSQAERRTLQARRKASRDIPQKTTNPELAMQMLRKIWSDE